MPADFPYLRRPANGVLYLLASLILGTVTSLLIASVASDGITLTFLRFIFGTLILLPLLPSLFRSATRLALPLWFAAFIAAASITFFFLSLKYIDAALVVAISATTPIVTLLLERILHHTHLTLRTVILILTTTAGAIIASLSSVTSPATLTGVILAVAMVVTGAAGNVMQAHYGRGTSPWRRTTSINIAGLALLLPLILLYGYDATASTYAVALFAAAAGGGLAVVLFLKALVTIPASVSSTLLSLGVPLTALGGWLWLSQTPTVTQLVGYTIIVISTVFLALAPPPRLPHEPPPVK